MPNILRFLLILCAAGWLAACSTSLRPGEDAAIGAVFDQARHHDFPAIEARLPPAQRNAVTDTRLQAQAALIPDRAPDVVKPVRATKAATASGEQIAAVREYIYPDRVLVVTTAILAPPGKPPLVLAFNIQAFPRAALAVGRFGLEGKSSTQYFLLGLAVLIPLLLVYALATLARDKNIRWKGLWTPFILVGFTQLSINWTTGAILFQPLSLLLLGAAVGRGALDVSPWVVTVSAPLGALIYLGRAWFAARPVDPD